LRVAGPKPALEYNLLPGLDEMILETIIPSARGNTLDPEVRNPAFQRREEVITSFSPFEIDHLHPLQ
jgi:hypothetical protein